MVNAALDLEEEIFRDGPSNQGRQRQRMIPHFLSPILLCRRQVASITLGPHLITGGDEGRQQLTEELHKAVVDTGKT